MCRSQPRSELNAPSYQEAELAVPSGMRQPLAKHPGQQRCDQARGNKGDQPTLPARRQLREQGRRLKPVWGLCRRHSPGDILYEFVMDAW